jgi:hypothetical protein
LQLRANCRTLKRRRTDDIVILREPFRRLVDYLDLSKMTHPAEDLVFDEA